MYVRCMANMVHLQCAGQIYSDQHILGESAVFAHMCYNSINGCGWEKVFSWMCPCLLVAHIPLCISKCKVCPLPSLC